MYVAIQDNHRHIRILNGNTASQKQQSKGSTPLLVVERKDMEKIKVSYDYEELINELKEEIAYGTLTQDDEIYVLRQEKEIAEGYRPIIDWDYLEDVYEGEEYEKEYTSGEKAVIERNRAIIERDSEKKKVHEVISEMLKWNKII